MWVLNLIFGVALGLTAGVDCGPSYRGTLLPCAQAFQCAIVILFDML